MSRSQEEKEKFFAELFKLDALANDSDPESDGVQLPKLRVGSPSPQEMFRQTQINQAPSVVNDSDRAGSSSMMDTEKPKRTRCVQPTEAAAPSKKRRKKEKGLPPLPEKDRVFNDQVFFFIPNDNVASHRRFRIDKTIQHGATWVRELSENVTHVIVDAHISYEEVVKFFGQVKNLKTTVLVNESWVGESLGFREMRDVTASRFQLTRESNQSAEACSHGQPDVSRLPSDARAEGSFVRRGRSVLASPDILSPKAFDHENDFINIRRNLDLDQEQTAHRISQKGAGRPQDALGELLVQVSKLGGQMLDLDDDESKSPSSDSFESVEFDGKTNARSIQHAENAGFRCMERNTGNQNRDNPNARTIEVLQQMATLYDQIGDQWRTRAYRQAISALKKQRRRIETREEALDIPLIGKRLALKIEEIAQTDKLRQLDNTMSDPTHQLLRLFMGIYQVGYPSASRWIAQGYRTLEELKTHPELTPNQRIGIEHYDDFSKRIPRAEVEQHAAIVREALRRADPDLQLIIGGSYRRGSQDCGDIDLIITKPQASIEAIRTILMEAIIPGLMGKRFLKIALASSGSRDNGSKWHGACALTETSVWRRIDLLFVPWDELGAALIYFTGNDIFNRSIRLLASRKGMRLNQHGLYRDVMRGKGRVKMTEGTLVEGHSEKRIFECLGVPWWEPHERQC